MEPIQYLRVIRRRWPVLFTLVVVGFAAGYLFAPPPSSSGSTPATASSYDVTAIYGMSSSTADPSGFTLQDLPYVASTPSVLAITERSLNNKTLAATVASQVTVTVQSTTGLLAISASEPSAAAAAEAANDLGSALVTSLDVQILAIYDTSLRLAERQLANAVQQVSQLKSQPSSSITQIELSFAENAETQQAQALEQLRIAGRSATTLHPIVPAAAATATYVAGSPGAQHSSTGSGKKRDALLGGLAGLLVGLGLALVWDRLDTRIRTREQAETILGLPVLGEVRRVSSSNRRRGLVVLDDPVSAAAEAYRMFQTTLALSSPGGLRDGHPEAVLLSSPGRLEGKEFVVANLAASFSEAGSSVAIVAADSFDLSLPALVRRPHDARTQRDNGALRWPPRPGAQAADSPGSATVIEGVSLLLNGLRPAVGNGQAHKQADLVSAGRRLAPVVLIDAPPVLLSHDASRLSAVADSVVLMCEIGGVTAAEARLAVERLRQVGAPLKGVVLVGRGGIMAKALGALWIRGGQHARGNGTHSDGPGEA